MSLFRKLSPKRIFSKGSFTGFERFLSMAFNPAKGTRDLRRGKIRGTVSAIQSAMPSRATLRARRASKTLHTRGAPMSIWGTLLQSGVSLGTQAIATSQQRKVQRTSAQASLFDRGPVLPGRGGFVGTAMELGKGLITTGIGNLLMGPEQTRFRPRRRGRGITARELRSFRRVARIFKTYLPAGRKIKLPGKKR